MDDSVHIAFNSPAPEDKAAFESSIDKTAKAEMRKRMVGSFAFISGCIAKVMDIDFTDPEQPVFRLEALMIGHRNGWDNRDGIRMPKYECVSIINEEEYEARLKVLANNPHYRLDKDE